MSGGEVAVESEVGVGKLGRGMQQGPPLESSPAQKGSGQREGRATQQGGGAAQKPETYFRQGHWATGNRLREINK